MEQIKRKMAALKEDKENAEEQLEKCEEEKKTIILEKENVSEQPLLNHLITVVVA